MSVLRVIDVAHPPRHPGAVELELADAVSRVRNSSDVRVLKVIHGQGSSGKGGTTRSTVRNWLFRNNSRVRKVIEGEAYDLFDPDTQEMRSEVGQFADPDLGAGNGGVTICWVK